MLTPRLGVCSWSLRATSAAELVERVRATGLDRVQLHLDPLRDDWDGEGGSWGVTRTDRALADAWIAVESGMMTTAGEDYTTLETIRETGGVAPDATWPVNLAAARKNAEIAAGLGLTLVTFHAGFIPHDAGDPRRGVLIDRLRELRDVFAEQGVTVALETGQESAETLLGVLDELDGVGVNFDPANMILYGMGDPIDALAALGPRVSQLHLKDATPASEPGVWGEEVPLGRGAVDWPAFFETAARVCPEAAMVIEREAGDDRVGDVRLAAELAAPRLERSGL